MTSNEYTLALARSYLLLARASKSQVYLSLAIKTLASLTRGNKTRTIELKLIA